MKIIQSDFDKLFIIELDIFSDDRGFFVERYNKKQMLEHDIDIEFIQDNHSRSKPGVIRGMHMQNDPSQTKLVGVSKGSIIDIVVDLRPDSKTYRKSFSIELSDKNNRLLLVPPGFIHGFYVNSDIDTDVLYKVDNFYSAIGEISIKWNDPDLNISIPNNNPIISERDKNAMSLKEYENKYLRSK